jgi:hypothetical protein
MQGLQLILFRDRLWALPSFRGLKTLRFGGFFLLDSQTLNKISIAAAVRLPTFQSIS